jgi:RNA polymerase sigma-70 factor (ECF subfamily)
VVSGGPPSIEELYRRYGPSVLRRARSLLQDEQAARDAMQEVFIRALTSKVVFHEGVSPMTWFYRVTTNLCLNLIRSRGRRLRMLSSQSTGEPMADAVAEDRVAVMQVLSLVPEELGRIAIYYFVDHMKQEEIAELLGVSRRTIGNRLEEFKKLARMELNEELEIA